jgi:hypothetical protein
MCSPFHFVFCPITLQLNSEFSTCLRGPLDTDNFVIFIRLAGLTRLFHPIRGNTFQYIEPPPKRAAKPGEKVINSGQESHKNGVLWDGGLRLRGRPPSQSFIDNRGNPEYTLRY